jgi:peptide/nickel transport system permease protein
MSRKLSVSFLKYISIRALIFIFTLLVSFSIIFLLLRLMPASIVDALLAGLSQSAQSITPEEYLKLRETLEEIFGLKGSLSELYVKYMYRFFTLDFGPSMIAFPTPVREIILNSLPWTAGLLSFSTIISWITGNMLGTLASFFERSHKNTSRVLQGVAVILYPIPYYIMALVLIFLFAYLIPLFPLAGAFISSSRFTFSLENIYLIIKASTLPALSMILVSALGWWFLSSRALTLNVLSEDYFLYAVIRGLDSGYMARKYVLKNILLPQTTALSLALGGIFNGALLTEIIFAYPGLGFILYKSVVSGDYSTAMGILSLSIIAVAAATFIIDVIYPLIDPRVRYR